MKGKRKKFDPRSVDTLAYLLIIFFIVIFIFLSLGRHDALRSFQNDLGTYSQLTWNTLHGNFFESSGALLSITLRPDLTTQEDFNYLAAHFSPILLIFVPFYALWANPKIFLILQALAVGMGALPIYWFAKEKIRSKMGAPIFLVSYLLYPILHNALLYDFHEVTFAVPIITFTLWFWHKKRTGWMLFFLVLLMLVQEHISLIVFMFGLYLAFFQKRWRFGLIISVVALAYFLTVILFVIPAFSSTGESTLIKTEALNVVSTSRYGWLGSGMTEIFGNILHKPIWVLKNMFTSLQIGFLITLLLPLFALPIFSSLIILSFPILALYFLSYWTMTYNVYFYHSSILVGIFFFAAILAFARLFQELKWQRIFLILVLISSFLVSYFYSVTPLGKNYYFKEYRPSTNAKLLKGVKKLIPADAPISVQHNLGPHFSTRRKLFHFPLMIDKSDYLIVDVFNPYAINPKSFYGFSNVREVEYQFWKTAISELLNHPEFGIIYSQDGWLVFKRGAEKELNEKAKKDFKVALERLEPTLTSQELETGIKHTDQ